MTGHLEQFLRWVLRTPKRTWLHDCEDHYYFSDTTPCPKCDAVWGNGGMTPLTIGKLAVKYHLTLRVLERGSVLQAAGLSRFYASFEGVGCMDRDLMQSAPTPGQGHTPEDAIADYVSRIAGRRLVRGAWTRNQLAFDVPRDLVIGDL